MVPQGPQNLRSCNGLSGWHICWASGLTSLPLPLPWWPFKV